MEVYSIYSITAMFNIYLCDYGTVLVDKNKTWQLLANLGLGKIPGRLKDQADKKQDDNMTN